jgi:hypothetical protein
MITLHVYSMSAYEPIRILMSPVGQLHVIHPYARLLNPVIEVHEVYEHLRHVVELRH